jgi:hypothetical protein
MTLSSITGPIDPTVGADLAAGLTMSRMQVHQGDAS